MSKYNVGLRNVGSYQASGTPWMTGSAIYTFNSPDGSEFKMEHRINFPYVTKRITVWNRRTSSGAGKQVRVYFQSTGSQGDGGTGDPNVITKGHFLEIDFLESVTMEVKCSHLFLSAAQDGKAVPYLLFAELTQIPTSSM